jgi:lipid A ethanolaminephosphotransferase
LAIIASDTTGFRRPEIGSVQASAIVALYLLFATNAVLWRKIDLYLWAYPVSLAGLYVALSALFVAVVTIFSVKYVIKPFFIFLITVAAIGSWFMGQFGVIIDADMVRNAFETTPAEAGNLVTPAFVGHLFFFAALPSLIVCWVRIVHKPIVRKVLWNTATVVGCLVVVGLIISANSKTFTTAIRQHRDIVKSINPLTPIVGTVQYVMEAGSEAEIVVQPLGLDAKVLPALDGIRKPRVTIVVAGETARAANFSLNGYGRETNPELKDRDIVYFPDTTSCGTATAISIPCMFSRLTRAGYSHSKALGSETLVDVLAHAGIDTVWLDNNTGSKGVADRISYTDLVAANDPKYCEKGECRDDMFLDKVDDWLNHVTRDSVIVLHQMGSHGPAYFRRYTDEFRHFTPDCRTAELGDCTDAEVVNAYDNSLLYTDHFLATLIDKLKARSGTLATGLIYASDHGESLGENGLYLHGAPYMFAPSQQTHVPFLVWFDKDFAASMGLDRACLAKQATGQSHSHDNFFHSILGMMNVTTSVYDPALDVFRACITRRTS